MNVSCPQCKTVFRVDPRKVPAEGVRARCSVCGGVFEVLSEQRQSQRPEMVAPPPPPAPPLTPPKPPVEPEPPLVPEPAPEAEAEVETHEAEAEMETHEVETHEVEAEVETHEPEPASPPVSEALTPPPETQERGEAAEAVAEPETPEPAIGPAPPPTPPPSKPIVPPPAGLTPPPTAPPFKPTPPPQPAVKPTPAEPVAGFRFGQPDQGARARRLARALISDLAAYYPDRQDKGLREGRLKELFQDELRKSWQEYVEQVGLEVAKSTPHFRDALNEILAKGKRVF
jgi:predicted Zn finger-like uncharacterized protein